MYPSVEIVIPSYNRLAVLPETLRQIRVIYPEVDICIGLQGDMPDAEMESAFDKDYHLRIVRQVAPSTTAILNSCIATSRADIVLILDDDAVPHFGCLESHIAAFIGNPDLVYTTGREVRFKNGRSSFSEWNRILVESFFGFFIGKNKKINGRIVGWINRIGLMFGNFNQPGKCVINSPRGCNMGIRRESFSRLGGFNVQFRGNAWGFEAEFGIRMARKGRYGQYRGDAIVVHHEHVRGGSRDAMKGQWFKDFIHNHTILLNELGWQGWIGSVPRLIKKKISR